jgi:SulP family sulfate permease
MPVELGFILERLAEMAEQDPSLRTQQPWQAAYEKDYLIAAAAALLGVLIFDTLPGLVIGIAVSLLLLVYRTSRPHIAELGQVPGSDGEFGDLDRHPDPSEIPGVKVVRVESGLFFANAEAVHSRIIKLAGEDGVSAVVLDSESMPYVDITASVMLRALAGESRGRGVTLAMAKEIGQVRDVLRSEGGDEIPLYATVAEAVAYRTPS